MRLLYHLTVCFITSVLLLTACESDAKKLQRLQGDRAVHCLLVDKYREDYLAAKKAKSPHADTLLQRWNEHNTGCEIATRDLDRFMR